MLLHQFKELEDQRTVAGCGLQEKDVLHLKAKGAQSRANNLLLGGLRRR